MSAQFWARLNRFEENQTDQDKEIKSLQERIEFLEEALQQSSTTLKLPRKTLSS